MRDEFAEVSALQLDDSERIADQLASYELGDPDALKERPYWAGLTLRDHGDTNVREALEIWAMHVLRFSRRDQLSANYAFRRAGLAPRRIEIDNYVSWFHRWPVVEERNVRVVHSKRAEEIARLTQEVGIMRDRSTTAEQDVERLTGSLSWKLTAPLRMIGPWLPARKGRPKS